MDLVPRPRPYLVSCSDPLARGGSGNETSPYSADQTRDGTGACKGVAREAKPKAS